MSKKPLDPSVPAVAISRRGVDRLRAGHVWVYRSDIILADGIAPGAIVAVRDERDKFLGTALYSTASQIAIRLISRDSVPDLGKLLRQRIREAIAYRERVVQNSDAYRLIFSEADFLPGLIVDRYSDVLAVQILTQAMDADSVRSTILSELNEQVKPAGIVERVDSKIRELEQLPSRQSSLLQGEKTSTVFSMNGVRFHYDFAEGQKTGAFLDQRENYAAAAQYAHGQALDVFCYQGGFALHLAGTCEQVTGVDSSRPALEVADRNAVLNGKEIEWIEANAFDLLRDYATAGRQYDTIVLDPPAFAKGKRDLEAALRGYKELNLRAMKMLRPEGVLVSCSCSYHVSQADFLEILAESARDVHKNLRILESRTQGKDHPILLNVPETAYLKCVIASVSY
ncbi:MAG TPA: class I SAM-dependent rRNA methyltransferase [Terriglobales bacterium]|nr:class I SAM-dependent rRNA methyltransferase [Terriglobales bacterium]